MVDGIQGNRPIANIKATGVEVKNNTLTKKLGLFGFGVKQNISTNGPLAELSAKFDFEPPAYKKGVSQLSISDADYIPDAYEENAFCEV